MAKFSGRIRVLLILTFLSKLTFAVQDALNDPSLEIIRQEDAEEGMDPGYSEPRNKLPANTIPHSEPNKGGKRFLESLQCLNPKTPTNKIKVLKGNPNHLYSAIEVSCPSDYHFPSGQEIINVTCLPLPDPCYCKAAWETLDQYLLIYDFNCTESLVCNNPKTSDNTVIKLDGNPYHMGSKVQVTCNGGRHFPNGLESVNVTCNPLPHPCMCLAEWMKEDNFDLMNDFNCTEQNTEKVETEIPPKSNVEVDTTEVNTLSEQEITDTVSVPDEKSGDEETNPDSKTETKAYDNKEREVYEGRNDLDIKSGSLVETNNEIYETGENIYKENNIPEKSIVEHNEQKDSSQSKKYETVEEGSKEESSSENGEILETQSEEENLDNNDRENELNGKSKYLKSLEQQVRPTEQSLIADEEEQTLNERETENKIRAEKESGDSDESFQTLNHDTTYDTEETEIENVHENEEIPEDDKSMKEDITSLEDDEPANIAKEDVREESPLDMKSDGEIYESVLVNNESSEKESSIPDDEEKVEYNEVNENEQEVDNELDEEEWESQEVKNYQEIVEHGENMRPEVVMLGETMPLNEHKVNVEELHEAEQEEGKENFVERINDDENSHRTEEKDENKEEEAEEEEDSQTQEISRDEEELEENHEIEHEELQKEEEEDENIKTLENPEKEEEHGKYKEEEDEEGTEVEDEPENDSRTEEKHVDEENELGNLENEEEEEIEEETTEDEQEEVEPPPAFYEAQNSPFHKMDEEVQPDEEEIDRCLQKPDSGFGKHAHWRLFFNSSTKECQNFLYGGIGGNANNFETLEDCLKACSTRHS